MARITGNSRFPYGINSPSDLLEKLRLDAQKLSAEPNPYDVFNFIITAAVLNEWCMKVYRGIGVADEVQQAIEKKDFELLPAVTTGWIINISCLPNKHCDKRRHIMNALRVCWDTAHIVIHIFFRSAPIEPGAETFMRFCLKIGQKVGIFYQMHQFCVRRHALDAQGTRLQAIDFNNEKRCV